MEKKEVNFTKTIEELKKKYNTEELNGKIINDFLEKIITNRKVG